MSGVEPWLIDCLPTPGPGIALDVGANVGAWTIELSRRCSEVHSFEPNPQAHQQLRFHTATLSNVRLFDLALGSEAGDVELNLYADSAWASAFREDELDAWREGEPYATTTAPLVTLDSLGYVSRDVRFVKVDVEGAERDVLEGAVDTIRYQRPKLLVEIHTLANREWVLGALAGHGYEPKLIPHPHAGVSEGHCWIVAEGD